MIDRLRPMAIFARVVDEGSFRAAAKQLNLAPSRVSETISELEAYLGTTLLYRTTRKITLTNEGRIFYARVVEMLRSAEQGLNELNALSTDPVGRLRISLPAFLASGPMSTAVAEFARLHPNVSFSVVYTDHPVKLIEEGFDLAVRVGWLDDTTLMSRKLADGTRHLVVGCAYAQARDLPKRPADLADWDWIRYQQRARAVVFTSATGETEKVTGPARIEVDSIHAACHLAKENMGVTILPSVLADQGVASGALLRLLPEWSLRPLGIHVVWPDKSNRESLARLFIQFLDDNGLCAPPGADPASDPSAA